MLDMEYRMHPGQMHERNNSQSRVLKIASSACTFCRKAKVKCDGVRPCSMCRTRNIECVFDPGKDARRGRKRTLDQLQSQAEALKALLDSLKSCDDESIQKLIHLIKDDAPLDELVSHTRLVMSENHNRQKPRNHWRRTVLDIAALIDMPPIRVPAHPWTTVTRNDDDVSHLISLYFTWQNFGYPSVDQDVFVEAMRSESLDSTFCSPFLVNCMLAVACVYSDRPIAFKDPKDPSTRALHFFDEAVRLWTTAQENVNLANLQALPAIIVAAAVLGRDRTGLLYTSQLGAFNVELVVQVQKSRTRGDRKLDTPEFQRSYALACWTAFLVQTEWAVIWSRPIASPKPICNYPYLETELDHVASWTPYPNTAAKFATEIPCHAFRLTNERVKLYEIAAELQPIVLSNSSQNSPLPGFITMDRDTKLDLLHGIHQNLFNWYKNLHVSALLTDDKDPILPEPLVGLHLTYHSFCIHTASHILGVTDITSEERDDARGILIGAAASIASIFEQRLETIGLIHHGMYTAQASISAAYGLLEYLDRPGIADSFNTVMIALSATARRWTLSRGVIKMIWYELQQRKLTHLVNKATLDLVASSAVESWTADDQRVVEKMAYPNYAAMKERGSAMAEMGDLLEEYSRLELSEKEETNLEAH